MFKILNRASTYLTIKPANGKEITLHAKSYSAPLADAMMSEDIRKLERDGLVVVMPALDENVKPDKPSTKKIEKILPSDTGKEGEGK